MPNVLDFSLYKDGHFDDLNILYPRYKISSLQSIYVKVYVSYVIKRDGSALVQVRRQDLERLDMNMSGQSNSLLVLSI